MLDPNHVTTRDGAVGGIVRRIDDQRVFVAEARVLRLRDPYHGFLVMQEVVQIATLFFVGVGTERSGDPVGAASGRLVLLLDERQEVRTAAMRVLQTISGTCVDGSLSRYACCFSSLRCALQVGRKLVSTWTEHDTAGRGAMTGGV